ncbi:ankyrin repeat-containing domain protein [Pelagophyceae sp. CCMP2097]|nr:ankyrin repeat-containing domain protein [Pelagophyceae sp. CCMP2097]
MPKRGPRPLCDAAREGRADAVRALLAGGAYINEALKGRTPLLIAAREGHSGVVQALIDARADLNLATEAGATALFIAAEKGHSGVNGHLGIVQALIDARADLNLARGDGTSPMSIAAQKGHFEVMKLLVAAKSAVPSIENARLSAEIAALSAENARLSTENAGLREGERIDVVDMETGNIVQETLRKRPRAAAPLAGAVDESDAAPPRSALAAVHQANTMLVAVKRERDDTQEEFLDEQDGHHTMRAFSLVQQSKITDLVVLALAGGGDPVAIYSIRDRH